LFELGRKTPRNLEFSNIPSNGGQMNAVVLSTTIEQQEASKIGRISRR